MNSPDRLRPEMGRASRAWDALARGAITAADADGLDPTLITTIAALQDMGDRPRPDAPFADRLEQDLLRAMRDRRLAALPVQPGRDVASGRIPLPRPWSRIPAGHDSARSRWGMAQLATAALVLLTLIGSYMVFGGPLRPRERDSHVAWMPAADDSPQTSLPSPRLTDETVLAQGTVDDIPPMAGVAVIQRTTLAPGAAWRLGASNDTGEGPTLYRVEAGALTIEADAPTSVTKTDTASPIPVEPGRAVTLQQGGWGLLPSGVTARWRNDGDVTTVVLSAGYTTIGSSESGPGVSVDDLAWAMPITPPATPVQIALRRLVLPPDQALPVEDMPGVELLAIESGQLEAADPNGAMAKATPSAVGASAVWHRIVFGSRALKTFPPGRVFRAMGGTPVTLLTMTATPLAARSPGPSG